MAAALRFVSYTSDRFSPNGIRTTRRSRNQDGGCEYRRTGSRSRLGEVRLLVVASARDRNRPDSGLVIRPLALGLDD
eukprot:2765357-Pyramimonas_sp.AAC.1